MKERFATFTVQIAKISRCIRKIKTEEMSGLNLKSPHVSCLYYLYTNGAMTAKELCDVCEEDKAAVSRSIDHLEKEGYIVCESTAKKRYRSPLLLTEKGKEIGAYVAETIDRIVDEAGVGLSDTDRAIFYKSLLLIGENLQNICDKYGE